MSWVNLLGLTFCKAFSLSGTGSWYYFFESTRCLVGCLVIICYINGTYWHILLSAAMLFCCYGCFLVPWLLFYSSQCSIDVKLDLIKKKKKKEKPLLFIWPLSLHLLLFCDGHFAFLIERLMLFSGRDAKWLKWRRCWHTEIVWGIKMCLIYRFWSSWKWIKHTLSSLNFTYNCCNVYGGRQSYW